MSTSYSLQAWINANTSLLGLIKAETGAATIKIKDAGHVTLAEAVIDETENSAVNGTTGILTLAILTQEDSTTAGTASYAQVCDGVGTPHIQLTCVEGIEEVVDYCVVESLTINGGDGINIISASIGVGSVIGV